MWLSWSRTRAERMRTSTGTMIQIHTHTCLCFDKLTVQLCPTTRFHNGPLAHSLQYPLQKKETRTNKKNTFQSVTRLLESTIIYQYHIVYPYTL